MFKQNITAIALVFGLSFTLPAMAKGTIVGQDQAVEANKIDLSLDKKKPSGIVHVEGCEKCPIQLRIDSGSKFYQKNKVISRKQAQLLSGKPGTVIYGGDEQRVLSIRW